MFHLRMLGLRFMSMIEDSSGIVVVDLRYVMLLMNYSPIFLLMGIIQDTIRLDTRFSQACPYCGRRLCENKWL